MDLGHFIRNTRYRPTTVPQNPPVMTPPTIAAPKPGAPFAIKPRRQPRTQMTPKTFAKTDQKTLALEGGQGPVGSGGGRIADGACDSSEFGIGPEVHADLEVSEVGPNKNHSPVKRTARMNQ